MNKCGECGKDTTIYLHALDCDEYVPAHYEELEKLYRALKEKNKALEGVVEAVKGCIHYLEEEGYCEGCDKKYKDQLEHNKWCNVGKLIEALKKLEEV